MLHSLRRVGPALLASLALLLAVLPPAAATTTASGPFLGLSGYYDYSDSAVRDTAAGTDTHWWCADLPGHVTDTIVQEQIRLADGAVTIPEHQVLAEGGVGTWDAGLVCNPSVVQGQFVDPFGDGLSYGYAMYYVGTAGSEDNSIGAAFSNDGSTWRKYPNPVLTFTDTGKGYYGYAQPNAVVIAGRVWLVFEDWDAPATPAPGPARSHARLALTTPGRPPRANATGTQPAQVGTHWYTMANPDGVTFAGPALMTSAGLPLPTPSWGGAAYNPADGRWYAAFNQPFRPASTTGGVAERGQGGVTLYSTGNLDTGTWTELDTIDTATTGSESNFIAGLLRDPSGNLAPSLLPTVQVDLSQSWPRPAYNASGAQLGDAGAFNSWQIGAASWAPGAPWRLLQRLDYPGGHHEVTTGWWDNTVYHVEPVNLGHLAEAPAGAATAALYSCKAGSVTYFVSLDSGCEGQYKLGLEGYAYSVAAADRIAIYRCVVVATNDHFVSPDPLCEGQRTEGLLGYTQN